MKAVLPVPFAPPKITDPPWNGSVLSTIPRNARTSRRSSRVIGALSQVLVQLDQGAFVAHEIAPIESLQLIRQARRKRFHLPQLCSEAEEDDVTWRFHV